MVAKLFRDGRIEGILAHGTDVTDLVLSRQKAEEQAVELEVQAETMQALNDELVTRTLELEREQAAAEAARQAADAPFRRAQLAVMAANAALAEERAAAALPCHRGSVRSRP